MEAILSIEIEIPSLRIVIDDKWSVSISIHDRILMLEGLYDTRKLSARYIEMVQWQKKPI